MILYRPVGLEELSLVYEASMRAFPPRLPEQPFFYPVTNEGYADQIAREWNTRSGTLAGFVTRFSLDDDHAAKFERRIVGAREHEELWVPAEELPALNAHIVGPIEVVAAHFGDGFRGHVPSAFGLRGKDATEQFLVLARTLPYSAFDFSCEIAANHLAVFLGFFLWEVADFTAEGFDTEARDAVLAAIRRRWALGSRSSIRLGVKAHAP